MITISKSMVLRWCKVDGQPGYLLTSGAKIKQSAVQFETVVCAECKVQAKDKRHEAYIKRFDYCLYCHSRILFPGNEAKQSKYRLRMLCNSTHDYMLRKPDVT